MKPMRYLLLCLVVVQFLSAQTPSGSDLPQRVILNLTPTPATSIAVTWRMVQQYTNAEVQYAAATPGTEFTNAILHAAPTIERLTVPHQPLVFHYSAVLTGLRANTAYVYRVGKDSCWTEWNQFSTAVETTAPFTFVWFGDPQDDQIKSNSRLFRQSMRTAPNAAFWIFSGDLTSDPEDTQIGELFDAPGFAFRTIPSIMVPGNHDMGYKFADGDYARNEKGRKVREKTVSPLWRAHYTLPENGIPGFEEASYTIDYQGVRFIMINSNDRLKEQAAWMEPLLASNPNQWTVVSFHHPLYSSGADRDDKNTREAFLPLFDKYHVDLVLTGHDHTYARSRKLVNGAVIGDDALGTVYVVSASGPKFYQYTSRYDSLMAKSGVKIQLYQIVAIDGTRLSYRAYTADGALYDSFELKK